MLWPHNKKFAVFLSHDVDQARKHLLQALYYFYQQKRFYHLIPQFFDNPYWTFETITKLEEECSVRSTFFFLNESIHFEILKPKTWRPSLGRYSIFEKEITKVIKKLDRGGWEIGLHGSYNSYRDKTLLANEKEDLEKILGKEVYGIRQHYLNLDIPNTWQIQRNLGLRYDASFGFRRKTGFKDNIYYPFSAFRDKFLIIPLVIAEDNLLNESGGDFRQAWQRCLQLINQTEKKQGLLSILWHSHFFNAKEFPGFREIYEKIIIECKIRNAWFGTGREIYDIFKNKNLKG